MQKLQRHRSKSSLLKHHKKSKSHGQHKLRKHQLLLTTPLITFSSKPVASDETTTTTTTTTTTDTKAPTAKELRSQQRQAKQQLSEADLTRGAEAPAVPTSFAVTHTVYSNTRAQDFFELQQKYPSFNPYPPAIQPTMQINEFIKAYSHLENGSRLREENGITLNGRIFTKRTSSSKLSFLDISTQDNDFKKNPVQVICSAFNMDEQSHDTSKILKKGDWVSVTGFPGKSDTGELSIIANQATLLSPALQYPPTALLDPNLRFRQRHLDLFVNQDPLMEIFRVRTGVMRELRQYLNNIGFVEVETPILWTQAGGATARPFVTTSNAFGQDLPLSLRIAPELFLKQLVIGGIERVYEIGKVFRNEGIDATHNPEFTSCELYQAHANYETLMDFTEDLLRTMVQNITGKMTVKILPPGINAIDTPQQFQDYNSADNNSSDVTTIDFSQPFKRLDVIQTLKDHGIELPPNLNEDESLPILRDICHQRGWVLKPPFTVARCLDTMISEVIEPMCIQPTFIMNHPIALSPLAKRSATNPLVTERFELFINTKEYANAYTELNIPSEQLERFTAQQRLKLSISKNAASTDINQAKMKDFIDDEAHPVDMPYCEALQSALPPLGGWGIGLDRFVMLLSQQQNIRDVLFFPIMK